MSQQQQQARWQPTRRQVLWTVGIVGVLTVSLVVGYRYGITLWDWMQLLVVPAVIAGGGIWFSRQQRERELEIAEQRTIEDRKIAQDRAETDRQIADQRRQDDTLQAYLDQIGQLLLEKDRPLRESKVGDEVRTLARARTLTVLRRLDGERKGSVIQFLYESELLTKDGSVLALRGADLSGAHLDYAYLDEISLSGTNLSGADLSGAHLSEADLSGANLSEASLTYADLSKSDLSRANLRNTDLTFADLINANLREANYYSVHTTAARPIGANPSEPTGTDLGGANLREADLSRTVLTGANLTGVDFSDANLSGANFDGATGIPEEELTRYSFSLEGVMNPR